MTVGPATIVIVPEHKQPAAAVAASGIRLFTVHVRRPYPDVVDPKLNTHSKLNDITACIQAYTAGADEALMLDPHGFVATCNSTHFFIVRRGEVWTSSRAFCLGRITRGTVLAAAGRGHPGARAQLQPDRRVRRRRGLRHRDLRRGGARPGGRRAHDRRRRRPPGHGPPALALPGGRRGRRGGGGPGLSGGPPGPVRLAVWSGPRNISYAHALVGEPPGHAGGRRAALRPLPARHRRGPPNCERVIAAGDADWRSVVATLLGPVEPGTRVFYQKHMAHHCCPTWTGAGSPASATCCSSAIPGVVASYARTRRDPSVADLGLPRQVALYDELVAAGAPRRCSTPPMSSAARSPTCAPCATTRTSASPIGCWRGRRGPGLRRGVGPPLVRLGVGVDRLLGVPRRRTSTVGPPRWPACGPLYQRLHQERWVL